MNKYGICLSHSNKYNVLDDIGRHFLDHAIELIKAGKRFVYVVDNIDWEEKVHDMRSSHQNRSVHAVATSMVFSRISSQHLPDDGPQHDVKTVDFMELVDMSNEAVSTIKDRYKVFVANILLEKFPGFSDVRSFLSVTTECENSGTSGDKSEIVTLPILMKDEKKYSDCVDVLDQLEQWTHEMYEASGLCQKMTSSSAPIPLIESQSHPDQPSSHVPPAAIDDDPLKGIKIPCSGDELTRVRFAGARDLRAGCHNAKQRLDHLYPYRIVGWHTKRSYLKVHYHTVYCRKITVHFINVILEKL